VAVVVAVLMVPLTGIQEQAVEQADFVQQLQQLVVVVHWNLKFL
jgi:hypothetical protein